MGAPLCSPPPSCRCIKPNDTKTAMLFTPELVLAQIRYLGLMENVRVRRAGYAFRQLYSPFLQRYKMLGTKTWPRWSGSDRYGGHRTRGASHSPTAAGWRGLSSLVPPLCREGTEVLLSELKLPPEELAYGYTKIFIRSPRTVSPDRGTQRRAGSDAGWGPAPQTPHPAVSPERIEGAPEQCCSPQRLPAARPHSLQLFDLEKRRQERISELATLIQKMFRGWRCRTQYQLMRKSQIIISAWFRGHAVRRGQAGVLAALHPPHLHPKKGRCGRGERSAPPGASLESEGQVGHGGRVPR